METLRQRLLAAAETARSSQFGAPAFICVEAERELGRLEAKLAEQQPQIEAWELIEKLRAPEGDSVTLFCDNPDFGMGPNNAIECHAEWTYWKERRFEGSTLVEALRAAYAASLAYKDHK